MTETVGGVEKASCECNLDKTYGKGPVKTYQKNGSTSRLWDYVEKTYPLQYATIEKQRKIKADCRARDWPPC